MSTKMNTTKMNPEVKKLWVERLRDPNIEQGFGALRRNTGEMCCLGVLCEIAVEQGVIPPGNLREHTDRYEYSDEGGKYDYSTTRFGVLPEKVRVWAGLEDESGSRLTTETVLGSPITTTHMGLNDARFTFKQLADLTEEQL